MKRAGRLALWRAGDMLLPQDKTHTHTHTLNDYLLCGCCAPWLCLVWEKFLEAKITTIWFDIRRMLILWILNRAHLSFRVAPWNSIHLSVHSPPPFFFFKLLYYLLRSCSRVFHQRKMALRMKKISTHAIQKICTISVLKLYFSMFCVQ